MRRSGESNPKAPFGTFSESQSRPSNQLGQTPPIIPFVHAYFRTNSRTLAIGISRGFRLSPPAP